MHNTREPIAAILLLVLYALWEEVHILFKRVREGRVPPLQYKPLSTSYTEYYIIFPLC